MILLGLCGLTIIITSGAIFEEIRNFISEKSGFIGQLINCQMCTGFWIGFLFSFVLKEIFLPPLIVGGLVSLGSWAIYNFVDCLSTITTFLATKILEKNIVNTEDTNE